MTANLEQVYALIEKLRKQAIGQPQMIAEKQAYEYQEQSVKVVSVLKLVRATQSLRALFVLAQYGLFIDFGAIVRCLNDCVEDVYFLLEKYPEEPDGHVQKFVKGFFENTIDGFEKVETAAVERAKIRAAVVRYLKDRHDDATQKRLEKIYKAFCGYVHTNYAHVMEVYNGNTDSFNLGGVPSENETAKRLQFMPPMTEAVLFCAAFTAEKFNLGEVRQEIIQAAVS